jgi:hypothetical protein
MAPQDYNKGADGIEYFTPEHLTSPGSLPQNDPKSTSKPIPTLFKPLTIRGVTLRNRIVVAPM